MLPFHWQRKRLPSPESAKWGLYRARLTIPPDLLTGYSYLPYQVRQAHHGARYMDYWLMFMWLSVDPMADKERQRLQHVAVIGRIEVLLL